MNCLNLLWLFAFSKSVSLWIRQCEQFLPFKVNVRMRQNTACGTSSVAQSQKCWLLYHLPCVFSSVVKMCTGADPISDEPRPLDLVGRKSSSTLFSSNS